MFVWPEANRGFVSGARIPEDIGEAWYFIVSGQQIAQAYDDEGRWRPFTHADDKVINDLSGRHHYLGSMAGTACFAVAAAHQGDIQFGGLHAVLGNSGKLASGLAGRAIQVCEWHRSHRFCGKCGAPTVEHESDRAMICHACGISSYPRLSPSIIVLVHRGNEVLLARNTRFPEGMYSTLAGFVEPGESIEQTLLREVHEEVGIRVKDLEYLGSQPWPFPNSLMLGFHAAYELGEFVLQEDEIADARWFACDNLPAIPGKVAISRWLIDDYLGKLGLPIAEQ